jgi:hypothetical protein
MCTTDESGHQGLPRSILVEGLPQAISAQELQQTLGTSAAFCSWDASHPTAGELIARWPYLFL